jgi:hypothetical protein
MSLIRAMTSADFLFGGLVGTAAVLRVDALMIEEFWWI